MKLLRSGSIALCLVFLAGCGTVRGPSGTDSGSAASPPNITSFSAADNNIAAGEVAALNWSISDTGANLTLSSARLGDVSVTGYGGFNDYPTETTVYTLTASNDGGTDSMNLSVTVGEAATPEPEPEPTPGPTDPTPTPGPTNPTPEPGPTNPTPSPTNPNPIPEPGPTDPTDPDEPTPGPTNPTPTPNPEPTPNPTPEPEPEPEPTPDPTPEPEPGGPEATRLLGRWTFTTSLLPEEPNTYVFDDTFEYEDELSVSGNDQYGNLVIGGYDPQDGDGPYYVYAPSESDYTGLDYFYYFDFVSENRVEGIFYFQDNFTREFSNEYPFSGVRN